MDGVLQGRALVVGGGIAGLLATRVLAESHLEVQVLDCDDLDPRHPCGPRRGVPQGRHNHALPPRGRQILEELFPGLTGQVVDAGAPCGDLLGDARLHLGGHRFARADADLTTVSVNRPYLESCLRARVGALRNVTFDPPTDVLGLVTSPAGQRVHGSAPRRGCQGSRPRGGLCAGDGADRSAPVAAADGHRGTGTARRSSGSGPRRLPAVDVRRRDNARRPPTRGGSTVRGIRMLIAALLVPGLVLLTSITLAWVLLRW